MEAESPDVVTLAELADAAGATAAEVERLLEHLSVHLVGGKYLAWSEAVRTGHALKASRRESGSAVRPVGSGRAAVAPATTAAKAAARASSGGPNPPTPDTLFEAQAASRRSAAMPALVSGAVHGLVLVVAVLLTSAGLGSTVAARLDPADAEQLRLVFLAIPGPGGGGGGGGARRPIPAPRALRKGNSRQSSPVPQIELPKPVEPVPKPKEVPKPPPPEEPPVVAPVASNPADEEERPGVLEESSADAESRGAGAGGGVGTGSGTGIGQGDGPGIGPGSGGGTGGGPYRPGSGIEPPRLLQEVRADYTEEARRAGVQGNVLLEIVVRRDGRVGDVRVLQGLGHGLERRATEAVRQWRFTPARRMGSPVDVIVEVAVEFRLR